jgi:hypothetical protein
MKVEGGVFGKRKEVGGIKGSGGLNKIKVQQTHV